MRIEFPVMMVGSLMFAALVVACARDVSTPAPTPSGSAAPSAAAAASPPTNSGDDPKAPVLSPDDAHFVDGRKGWGWGDRCFNEIKQGKLGWARAACDRALALPDVDPKARPALLYNEGLIAKRAGEEAMARDYFGQSLTLRPASDPGRPEVQREYESVGGKLDVKTFPCGDARCPGDGRHTCCQLGNQGPTCVAASEMPDWCYNASAALRGSCDSKTNEPCATGQKCCLLARPAARAANPVCMSAPAPGDCLN
jgi:hypothetical protein